MAIIREQVNHDAIGKCDEATHLGRSIPHTAELVKIKTSTRTTKITLFCVSRELEAQSSPYGP